VALHYAGVAVALREVALRNKPAELLAISPAATVPVLQLPGGQLLLHSLDIMLWALAQHDPQEWLGRHDRQGERWVQRNDEDFKPLLDRYKYAQRHPMLTQAEHRAQAMHALIEPLEQTLSERPWLAGTRPGLADAALLPFVRQFALVQPEWFQAQPMPALQRWLQTQLDSPAFVAVMAKPSPAESPLA
jgi:glutathione S-transferase